MQRELKTLRTKQNKNITEVEVHMSKYKEIIDGLKNEIDVLRDQLRVEQEKKCVNDKTINKQLYHNHMLNVKQEKLNMFDVLETSDQLQLNDYKSQIVDQDNCMSDLSCLNIEIHETDENKEEINWDLEAVKREKEELENKLNSNDISICYAESSYFEKIRNQLYTNFEEEWDINHSIAEINELQKENNERILNLANDMEELIELKEQAQNEDDKILIGDQLNIKLNEIENLEKAMEDNANVLKEWVNAKKINEENRNRIQSMFTNIQSSKKKDIIEMQIAMRKLKLEKTDLHLQNLQIK